MRERKMNRESALKLLSKFKNIKENWNSYGARSPDLAIVEVAARAIENISNGFEFLVVVSPTPSGGVGLEWHHGDRELQIGFVSIEKCKYLKWSNSAQDGHEGECSMDDIDRIHSLIDWLMTGDIYTGM